MNQAQQPEALEAEYGSEVPDDAADFLRRLNVHVQKLQGDVQLAKFLADDERDHSDEDAAIAAGKVQAAVHGRVS